MGMGARVPVLPSALFWGLMGKVYAYASVSAYLQKLKPPRASGDNFLERGGGHRGVRGRPRVASREMQSLRQRWREGATGRLQGFVVWLARGGHQ